MTDSHSDLPQLPLDLPLRALIGLRNPEQGDWAALRAIQYGQLHQLSRSRALAHAMGVIITLGLFLGKVPVFILGPWVLAVVLALWNSFRIDRDLADIDRRSMTRHEFRRQTLGVAASSTAIAAPPLSRTAPRIR